MRNTKDAVKYTKFNILQLPAIYMICGACSMIYQLVWIHKLCLIFGSSITAVSVVAATFFLGLGLGGWIGGLATTSITNPLKAYAFTEAGVSLCAIFVPFVMIGIENIYNSMYQMASMSISQTALIRVALSALILLPPTTLMGATVPFIIQAYSKRTGKIGSDVGLIYGMNAIGGATGVLVAGFVLFKYFGSKNTNIIAVSLNIIAACVALYCSRNNFEKEISAPASLPEVHSGQWNVLNSVLLIAFGLSGFMYISYEILWMRYLQLFFRDSIYLYISIISAVIYGVAFGGMFIGRLSDRSGKPQTIFASLSVGSALLHTACMISIVKFHEQISVVSMVYPNIVPVAVFIILIPPFSIIGGTFPAVAKTISSTFKVVGKQTGISYFVNTIGCLFGSLMTQFVLLPAFGIDCIMWLFLFVSLSFSVIIFCLSDRRFIVAVKLITILCFVAPLIYLYKGNGNIVNAAIDKLKGPAQLVSLNQGKLGTNWVVHPGGDDRVVLYENLVAFSRGGSPSFIVQGFIPMLLAPEKQLSVLGLCFGGGLTYYGPLLFDNLGQLDLVDISRDNVDMALKFLPINKKIIADTRVRFYYDDAYSFTKYSKTKYDIIQIDSNPPFYSHNCATLYTREFYRFCLNLLNNNGLFTQVLPIKQLKHDEMRSILKTFSSVFPHVALWWNGLDPVMIGSNDKIEIDVGLINTRLSKCNINIALQQYSSDAKFDTLGHFLSGFLFNTEAFHGASDGGMINTTDKNYLEYSTDLHVDLDNIKIINKNLASWDDIANQSTEPDIIRGNTSHLEARRQYLMGMSLRWLMLNRLRL